MSERLMYCTNPMKPVQPAPPQSFRGRVVRLYEASARHLLFRWSRYESALRPIVELCHGRRVLRYGCSFYARRGWWALGVPV